MEVLVQNRYLMGEDFFQKSNGYFFLIENKKLFIYFIKIDQVDQNICFFYSLSGFIYMTRYKKNEK
jgi:hypothetical protein